MVNEIRIYVEGGGKGLAKEQLREGFREFFKDIKPCKGGFETRPYELESLTARLSNCPNGTPVSPLAKPTRQTR